MNKRLEDRLIAYAFGDVTPEEALILEQEAVRNPEASALLSDYKRIKTSMATVQEIPPHQLSADRLKEAILRDGLAPRRTSSAFRWIWAPLATAALALYVGISHGLLTPRQAEATNGSSVAVKEAVKTPETSLQPVLTETSKAPVASNASEGLLGFSRDLMRLAANGRPERAVSVSRHRFHPAVTESVISIPDEDTPEGKALINAHGAVEAVAWMPPNLSGGQGDLRSGSGAEHVRSSVDKKNSRTPSILMIESGRDSSTELPAATEVSNSNDVVIGG